jgi:hypothetical protein
VGSSAQTATQALSFVEEEIRNAGWLWWISLVILFSEPLWANKKAPINGAFSVKRVTN